MHIDAIAISTSNFEKTVAFYSLLGFEFPKLSGDEQHVEPIIKKGQVRLMIDHKDLLQQITGIAPVPPTHSSFALLCESPAQVDAVVQKVRDAGFAIVKEPWDAFWGQRYAIVQDPDGYKVDIFAPL